MNIFSALGKRYGAGVTKEGHLLVEAISKEEDFHVNLENERYWSLPVSAIDPTGANDYFFYLKNGSTKTYVVPDIRIKSTVAGVVEVREVTGTAAGSLTDVTPVNRTLGSSQTPDDVTIKTSPDVTGLTNAGIVGYLDCVTANKQEHLGLSAGIVIPPGKALALLWDTSTGVLTGMVSLFEVTKVVART